MLTNISDTDDGVESVNLPFVFQWRGQVNYTQVEVRSNGAVFPGGNHSDVANFFAYPVKVGGVYSIPRIAVWQQDLDPRVAGNIHVAIVDGVLVISWKGVPQFGGLPENGLNFQVALHPGGNIEIHWSDGNPPTDQDTFGFAGIKDEAGVAVPATRFPFGNEAYDAGIVPSFPSNQCRIFVAAAMGNYTELPSTSWMSSISPTSSPSISPPLTGQQPHLPPAGCRRYVIRLHHRPHLPPAGCHR